MENKWNSRSFQKSHSYLKFKYPNRSAQLLIESQYLKPPSFGCTAEAVGASPLEKLHSYVEPGDLFYTALINVVKKQYFQDGYQNGCWPFTGVLQQ